MYRLILFFLLTSALAPAQMPITSDSLRLTLDKSNGYGISSLYSPKSQREFISLAAKLPLYRITLSNADKTTEITSAEASSASVVSSTATNSEIVFEHAAQRLRITCTVRIETSAPRLVWGIRVANTGGFAIRSLYYPQWPAPLRLGHGEDRLLYPFLDGQEFISPGEHMREGRFQSAQYPGQAAMQLIAYHDDDSGMLEMTRDGDGWVKHFRAGRIPGALDLSLEHNPDETAGKSLTLPYDIVFELFRGGWQDAADVYREWAVRQKWARHTIADRPMPRYLTGGLPIVTFAMRGDPYSAEWSMYFPPSNRLLNPEFRPEKIPGLMQKYSEFFGSKVISNPFGWEHIAPWIAGEYFPPVEGEEVWSRVAAGLHSAGDPLFMLLSGLRWGVRMDNVGYNDRERFLKEVALEAAAYDASGRPYEEEPPWAASIGLCVGTPFARRHQVEAFVGCVKRGASMVQYDQNHGGAALACYSRAHGHTPGYGRWMVDETERMFGDIRTECTRVNPQFALAVEEPCEYFIPYWEVYMGRPYEYFGTGLDPSSDRRSVPLFLYVYHEFLAGYGGSNEIDIMHPWAEAIKVARKFTNGTLLEIDPGKPAFHLDSTETPTEEMRLARDCSHALQSWAGPYLIFGRMLRDPHISGVKAERAFMWRDAKDYRPLASLPSVEVPFVMESSWEREGKVGYVFANWTTSQKELSFTPEAYHQGGRNYKFTFYTGSTAQTLQNGGPLPPTIALRIPALSAALVQQEIP